MSVVRSPVSSAVSAVAISVLGGGAVSIGAQLDNALEAEAADGDAVTQPDFTDLTSLFTSGGANPTPGDVVTQAVGTEAFGGKSFEDWVTGETNVAPALSTFTDVLTVDWSANGVGYELVDNTGGQARPGVIFGSTVSAGAFYAVINVRSITGATQIRVDSIDGTDRLIGEGENSFICTPSSAFQARFRIEDTNTTVGDGFILDAVDFIPLDSLWTGTATSLDKFNQSHPALTDNGGRGEELVENGDFSSGLSVGWTFDNGAIGTLFSDRIRIENGIAGAGRLKQTIVTEIGATYELPVELLDSDIAGSVRVSVDEGSDTFNGDLLAENPTGAETYTFVATSTTAYVNFYVNSGTLGAWVELSIPISVRKVLTAFDERGPELVAGNVNSVQGSTSIDGTQVTFSGQYDNARRFISGLTDGGTYQIQITARVLSGNTSLHFFHENANVIGGADNFSPIEVPTSEFRTFTFKVVMDNSTVLNLGIQDRNVSGFGVVDVQSISVSVFLYPNLVTNGTFDADSDWTKPTGVAITGGQAVFSSVGTGNQLYQDATPGFGWLRFVFHVSEYTEGGVQPLLHGATSLDGDTETVSSVGWHVAYIRAKGAAPSRISLRAIGTTTLKVSACFVQEVPASIPRLNVLNTDGSTDKLEWDLPARRNLLTYTEDFSNGAWVETVVGSAVLPVLVGGLVSGPTSVQNAQRVQLSLDGSTGTGDISLFRQANATTGSLAFSIYLRSHDGSSSYTIQIVDPTGNAQNVTVTGAWQRFTVSGTASGSINYGIRLRGGQAPANSDFADILIAAPQLETGSTATDYQRVGAALHDDMTVVMAIKTSDTQGMLLNSDNVIRWLGAFHDGSSSPDATAFGSGSPSLEVDGASFAGSSRDDLHALIADSERHVVAFVGVDMSTWAKVVIGFYDTSSAWNAANNYAFLSIFPTNSETLALAEAAAAEKIKIVDPTYALAS